MAKIPLKRRKRGTGGISVRHYGWDATWVERGKRRSRRFRSYDEAEQFLRCVTAEWRDIWLNELRGLLWAELQARLRFNASEIVSIKSRRIA